MKIVKENDLMNFANAYTQLLAGKKIRRKGWEPFMHLVIVNGSVKTFKGETINYYGDSSLLISKDWMIVDGDGKKLSFIEALEELKNKKSITREGHENSYIFIDNGNLAICKAVEYDFMPSYKCLCSSDWEIMK